MGGEGESRSASGGVGRRFGLVLPSGRSDWHPRTSGEGGGRRACGRPTFAQRELVYEFNSAKPASERRGGTLV